jgi:hypothetical protein
MSQVFLNNVELYFVKCDPNRPSRKMDPKKPQWEVQIRTVDPAVNTEWAALGLPVKFQIPNGKTPADGFFRCNLAKRAFKKDGEPAQPVEVVTGNLQPLNPNTIGNGSRGNLRLLYRDYEHGGRQKRAWYLMGIQVTFLKPYEGGSDNDFESAEYTVEAAEAADNGFTQQPVQFTPPVNTNRPPNAF